LKSKEIFFVEMYKSEIKIKYSDCDAGGRIFFARIFDYAHQTFEEFINEKYSGNDFFNSPEFAVPIVKSSAVFLKPILMHSKIDVILRITEIREHSFSITYYFETNKVVFAEVQTVHVFIDKSNDKKIPIPVNFKKLLAKYFSETN